MTRPSTRGFSSDPADSSSSRIESAAAAPETARRPRCCAGKRLGISDAPPGIDLGSSSSELDVRSPPPSGWASARSSSGWTPAPPSSKRSHALPVSTLRDGSERRPEPDPPAGKRKIVILGGGPNRIGQGIEFDYCCVHAAFALREEGFETIMVNCNPETVSHRLRHRATGCTSSR